MFYRCKLCVKCSCFCNYYIVSEVNFVVKGPDNIESAFQLCKWDLTFKISVTCSLFLFAMFSDISYNILYFRHTIFVRVRHTLSHDLTVHKWSILPFIWDNKKAGIQDIMLKIIQPACVKFVDLTSLSYSIWRWKKSLLNHKYK